MCTHMHTCTHAHTHTHTLTHIHTHAHTHPAALMYAQNSGNPNNACAKEISKLLRIQ